MEIKNEKTNISKPQKKEDLNQLITFCYSTAISYLKSKISNSENLPEISQQFENLAVSISASMYYFDEFKCIRLAPEHEKAMNELSEVDFKFHLFESIRSKLDEEITNNSIFLV